jgi:hypothetical protein
VIAGSISLAIIVLSPQNTTIPAVLDGLSVLSAGYALIWIGVRTYTYLNVRPNIDLGLSYQPGHVSLHISNQSRFPIQLEATQFHYCPEVTRIRLPDGTVEEYESTGVAAETFDPRIPYMTDRQDTLLRWSSKTLEDITSIGIDLERPPNGGEFVIPVLYLRFHTSVRPVDLLGIGSIPLLSRLYDTIPLRPIEFRYEQESPRWWDSVGPTPVEDPQLEWPDYYSNETS